MFKMIMFSPCTRVGEIPFTLPPRFSTQKQGELEMEENEEVEVEMKTETRRDILAHRGSLSVRSRS